MKPKVNWLLLFFILCCVTMDVHATVAFASEQLTIAKPFGPSVAVPDPAKGSNGWYTNEAGVTETLFVLDPEMNLKPCLAASFQNISPLSWEVGLKKNVRFHDDSPLNAMAVKWSIARLVDPKSDVFNRRIQGLLDIDEIIAKNEDTLIFKTRQPNAAFIYDLTSPATAIISPGSNPDNIYGSGPFVLEKVTPKEQMIVSRFEKYWGELARIDKVFLKIIQNPATRMLGFEAGQLDLATNFPENDAVRIASRKDSRIVSAPTNRLCFFFVRVADGPLSDPRIRQAVNHAIDRQELVDAVLAGFGGQVAASVFPAHIPWSDHTLQPYAYDPEEAQKLLADAGAEDRDRDGVVEIAGRPLVLQAWTYEGRASLKPVLELIQAQLYRVGIGTTLKVTQKASPINRAMKKGDVHLGLQMWNVAPQGDPDFFISNVFVRNSGSNFMGYHNPELDLLAKKGKNTFDPGERKKIYDRIQKIIYEDSPVIALFHKSMVCAVQNYVKNYRIHPAEKYLLTPRLYRDHAPTTPR